VLERSWGEGEAVRNPASLMPALVARPRAFGESTMRRDVPDGLVSATERCDKAGAPAALPPYRADGPLEGTPGTLTASGLGPSVFVNVVIAGLST
jgi:hypothetical protein